MTAVNDEGGDINKAKDIGGEEDTIPRTMQKYRERGEGWMLVVDDNCMFPSLLLRSFVLVLSSSSSSFVPISTLLQASYPYYVREES